MTRRIFLARALSLAISLVSFSGLRADFLSYGGKHELSTQSERYIVNHVHDWSASELDDLYRAPDVIDYFFSEKNTFSRIVLVQRARGRGRVLFDLPAPALTHLWISPDQDILVGLSSIKLNNPVQLAVWTLPDGRLLWREHIIPGVIKLDLAAWADLLREHPEKADTLTAITRFDTQAAYIDFSIPTSTWDDSYYQGKPLQDDFFKYRSPHPYSPNFRESVSNWVHWYRESDPGLRLDTDAQGNRHLSLLDPAGIRFRIRLPSAGELVPGPTPATPYPQQDAVAEASPPASP